MGIGEKKTPSNPLVNACDVFVYTENLVAEAKSRKNAPANPAAEKKKEKRTERGELDRCPRWKKPTILPCRKTVGRGWILMAQRGSYQFPDSGLSTRAPTDTSDCQRPGRQPERRLSR